MKKRLCILALALCMALFCGCAAKGGVVADITAEPEASAAPAQSAAAGYTLETRQVFYPEGSDEASAEYILRYELPVFADGAMNEAVTLWETELLERVNTERLPFADRAEGEEAPYTRVTTELTNVDGYTNILFGEEAAYGGESEHAQSALVLDPSGAESSLYAIAGLYAPEALIAQQVYNYIDTADPARQTYYGDVELADIQLALDLYNGFLVKDGGYTLLFANGVLADESQGLQRIDVAADSLHPDFVGEEGTLTHAEYDALLPALHKLAVACGGEYRSFSDTPDPLSYTLFMAQVFGEEPVQSGVIIVPQASYEAAAKGYFAALPADLTGGDGTALVEGSYHIPAPMAPSYGVRLDECAAEGDTLTLRGMLYYGAPGSADCGELAPVSLEVRRDAGASCGFLLTGFLFV